MSAASESQEGLARGVHEENSPRVSLGNDERNRQVQEQLDSLENMAERMGIQLTGLDAWTQLRQNILQMSALENHPSRPAWLQYVLNTWLWKCITKHYQCWQNLMLLITLFSVFMAPIQFGFFDEYSHKILLVFDCMVMLLFVLDFFIQFIRIRIKCEPKNMLLSIWSFILYFLDAFTSGPWATLYKKRGGLSCRIITIVRIIQIRRFTKIFVELEKVRDHKRFTLFKMLQLNFILFFSAHVAGCIFYLIPTCLPERERKKTWFKNLDEIYPNFLDENGITRYSVSLYFSFTTITSVGYGDIHPIHISERIFNIFFKVFGVFILAYVTYEFGRVILKYLQNPPILAENPTADESRQNDQGDD